jgi:hypothetical protein
MQANATDVLRKRQNGISVEQATVKFFAALLGASVLMAAPAQAQMVFTPQHASIDSAQQMLPLCQNEIAQGHPGLCTGYIIAVALEMAVHREGSGCLPGYLEYDDMLLLARRAPVRFDSPPRRRP